MPARGGEPREFHVALTGSDGNDGGLERPLRTISAAACLARAGDVITVHAGVYRERIDPPHGGESDERRIVYRAAVGETAEIRGSEVVTGWRSTQGGLWQVTVPNRVFGDDNPYAEVIRGDWFDPRGRTHHTGRVYVNGVPLREAARLDDVSAIEDGAWFAEVDGSSTTIWARFGGLDPNHQTVEINVRPAVFYPSRAGINYLTVRGFVMRHAATQWAPPTTEQIGLLGTHWSKGWLIENNIISDSRCAGLSLGKYGGSVDDVGATADRYNETIQDALTHGWARETIGGHVVRNNVIYNCEQAGICGSLGGAFSEITGNEVHHIHVERLFGGAEMAGIKLHGAIDTEVRDNCIHHAVLGIWLDWMAQGTRCSGNLLYANSHDAFIEVSHGPYLFDNNMLLSEVSVSTMSQGGAFAHNLVAGRVIQAPDLSRFTPYLEAHSTRLAGLSNVRGGDDRFLNNVFAERSGLGTYDAPSAAERFPVIMRGNVFLDDATPSQHETSPARGGQPSDLRLSERDGQVRLQMTWDVICSEAPRQEVTAGLLGQAIVPGLGFSNPDGTAVVLDHDYFGRERGEGNPVAGPLAHVVGGTLDVKVWPR